MKYSTYIKPRPRTNIRPRFRLSFFLKRVSKWTLNSIPYIVVFSILIALGIVIYKFSILTVNMNRVEIKGVGSFISLQDFKTELEYQINGKNMLKIDESAVMYHMKGKFLGIKDISIKKKIPTFIFINVVERIPAFLLNDGENNRFMVDIDGFVLGAPSDKYKDLPNVNYNRKVETGTFVNGKAISLYREIKESLNGLPLNVKDIVLGDDFAMVYLQNDITVYISNNKEVGNSFEVVYSILSKFSTEDKKVSKIDLRYDKVIVSYD
jgi:cell division septal protein FtsQ